MTKEQQLDDEIPSAERQAELEAVYEANIAAGKEPYEEVEIRTRGELRWVIAARGWSVDPEGPGEGMPADREWVNLSHARLLGIELAGENLMLADLSYTDLKASTLSDVSFWNADLSGADLSYADLSNATLADADLTGAILWGADLSGADLQRADLSSADLTECRLDEETLLADVQLDTCVSLADVLWNGVRLTKAPWEDAPRLGDETMARQPFTDEGKLKDRNMRAEHYDRAARAYLQLAEALRNQGLTSQADKYTYRGRLMQREAFHWNRHVGELYWSWFWFLICGYGYRLRHIVAAYGAVLFIFSFAYWVLGVHTFPHESGIQALWDSFLVSLSAIHGRTTFEQLGAWSVAAWVAAVESVFGIVIEGVFVAMLIQRLFAR